MPLVHSIVFAPIVFALAAFGAAPSAQSDDTTAYAWAVACKDCHKQVYESWERTKHEHALGRLSAAEQEQSCIQCHVTGGKTRVMVADKVANGGIQCESCHGPGRAHISDPAKKGSIRRVPDESTCTSCHSDRSPHFKYFNYQAMSSLSHATGK